jgi:hypothetical protein
MAAQEITYTLFDATYRVATALGITTESVATDGSATTLLDSVALTQADNYWVGGTIWILRDSLEGGASPEGKYGKITAFAASDDKATFATMTDAVTAGDRYAIGKKRYPLDQLIRFVNDGLTDMGVIEVTDITSLDTAANKTEYTLPDAVSYDLREVWIQGKLNDANDFQWEKISPGRWSLQATAIGTGTLLILPQLPSGRDLKLVYVGEHARLDDYNDEISESVHISRVVNAATLRALIWRRQKVGMGDPTLNEQIAYFSGLALKDELRYPIRLPARPSQLLIIGPQVKEDRFTYPGPA